MKMDYPARDFKGDAKISHVSVREALGWRLRQVPAREPATALVVIWVRPVCECGAEVRIRVCGCAHRFSLSRLFPAVSSCLVQI